VQCAVCLAGATVFVLVCSGCVCLFCSVFVAAVCCLFVLFSLPFVAPCCYLPLAITQSKKKVKEPA